MRRQKFIIFESGTRDTRMVTEAPMTLQTLLRQHIICKNAKR